MKFISILLAVLFLVACSEEPQQENNNNTEKADTSETKVEKEPDPEFPKFETVVEVLKSSGDYREKDGNLKVLSSDGESLHIQVSKWVFEGDPEETITNQVKRNIVYVSFQAFAKTSTNELTVTSIPQKFEDKGEYLDTHEKTVTVNRETAKQILNKRLNTTSFQDLFELDNNGKIWLPNDKFEELRYEKLDAVCRDLAS